MENLYETGGNANIILRTKITTKIGDKSYAAKEPVLMRQNVFVDFSYDITTSIQSAKKAISSYQEARPQSIKISNLSLSSSIVNLLFQKENQYNCHKTQVFISYPEDGKIILPTDRYNNTPVFVYDENSQCVECEVNGNMIEGNLNDSAAYKVIYEENIGGESFSLETPSYPYFSLEIQFCGNTNKETSYYVMYFDAVKLVTSPNLGIIADDIQNVPLIFDIIYEKQEEPKFMFLGE